MRSLSDRSGLLSGATPARPSAQSCESPRGDPSSNTALGTNPLGHEIAFLPRSTPNSRPVFGPSAWKKPRKPPRVGRSTREGEVSAPHLASALSAAKNTDRRASICASPCQRAFEFPYISRHVLGTCFAPG